MIHWEETLRVLYDAGLEFVIGRSRLRSCHERYRLCYERTQKIMERMARAIASLHPKLRNAHPIFRFAFDTRTISEGMNFALTTTLGDLDFLEEVTGLGSYKEVLAQSDKRTVGGLDCRVLSPEGLIEAKQAAGRSRDFVLPELRGLAELKKTGLE